MLISAIRFGNAAEKPKPVSPEEAKKDPPVFVSSDARLREQTTQQLATSRKLAEGGNTTAAGKIPQLIQRLKDLGVENP